MDNQAIHVYNEFSREVDNLFSGCLKAMYAYGSAVYDDLHIGYSDLDFFAVLSCEITQEHFDALLAYRKRLKKSENMLFGMLEGEFVPESLLVARKGGNVAYWGTTGERMKDGYDLVGFSMRSLLENGVLVYGEDVRSALPCPSNNEMLGQVRHLIKTVRSNAATTNEDVHSADWLFLISQSLYWLKTGEIACKTRAAQWAKEAYNKDWRPMLEKAIQLRANPEKAKRTENRIWLSGLGNSIQAVCDVLEREADNFYPQYPFSFSINPSSL